MPCKGRVFLPLIKVPFPHLPSYPEGLGKSAERPLPKHPHTSGTVWLVFLPRNLLMTRQKLSRTCGPQPAPAMVTLDDKSYVNSMGIRTSPSAAVIFPGATWAKPLVQMRKCLLTCHVPEMSVCTRPMPWEILVIPDVQRPRLPLHRTGFGILYGHFAT